MTSGMFVPTAAMKARMMTVPGSESTISLMRFMRPSPRRLRGCPECHGHGDRDCHDRHDERDEKGGSGRRDEAGEQVATELVGSEQVRERRSLKHGGEVLLERPVAQPERTR